MSVAACAALVERGDPDRFRAAMVVPVAARDVLFPLYAFNLEVARAPWVTQEPMIAEMRLQWWRDVLQELAGDGTARRHEVVDAMGFIDGPAADLLEALIDARRWDIEKAAFKDAAAFDAYIQSTAGNLMWTAARSFGAPGETEGDVRRVAFASGLARFLQAVPDLEAAGRIPLVDGRAEAIAALADRALTNMPPLRRVMRQVGTPARAAILEAWQAPALLGQVRARPGLVSEGWMGLSPFGSSLRLMRLGFS
ncbi:squalene/phytoene synthase family protein [Aestuariibius insulae]|uniref:squalene/phytoene synthase family protein n=1 Tax=Aestuariibius insulae TaxID=2058287 RepID=UPI00345EAA14